MRKRWSTKAWRRNEYGGAEPKACMEGRPCGIDGEAARQPWADLYSRAPSGLDHSRERAAGVGAPCPLRDASPQLAACANRRRRNNLSVSRLRQLVETRGNDHRPRGGG